MSKIDLQSGFWQVKMEAESIKYTTFQFEGKLYRFRVMPFGLKNAPATFVTLINEVLKGLIGDLCFVYIDDIIIFSKTLKADDKQGEIGVLQERGRVPETHRVQRRNQGEPRESSIHFRLPHSNR